MVTIIDVARHAGVSKSTVSLVLNKNPRVKEETRLRVEDAIKTLMLQITDERNALERVMLHFAHFEKQAERIDDRTYFLKMNYYESNETEIVIRVLSFGPCVKVIEPESFIDLVKERLFAQKSCGLR